MTTKTRLTLAAAALVAGVGFANAQPMRDRDAHHPGAMPGMTMMHGPMGAFQHIEGRLAFAKAELKITDAQAPQWNAFAAAIRTIAASQQTAMQGMMPAQGPGTAPALIERHIAMMTSHLDAMKAILAAVKPLYAVLSDEQKKTADGLMAEHMMSEHMMPMPMPMRGR